jgi:predicted MFS family arabinose efflux permease
MSDKIAEQSSKNVDQTLSPAVVCMLAIGCAVTVANLWYAQPLLATMATEWHVSQETMGTIAGCPLAGYATGTLLFVPLGDIFERRRLILIFLVSILVALFAFVLAPNILVFQISAYMLGIATIVPQLIIPYAVGLTEPGKRGHVVGMLMTGLLTGILLSRTVGGIVAEHFGWRAVYWGALVINGILLVWFSLQLRESRPTIKLSYFELVRSMFYLATHEPVLMSSAFFGAMTFACFNILWTVLSFFLSGAPYFCNPQVVGYFGLMGLAGAVAARYVGKLADHRGPMFAIGVSLIGMAFSYIVLSLFSQSLIGIAIGVLLLDLFVQSSQISNMTRIYSLHAENHSRLNTVYMVSYFVGGTAGAWLGTLAWTQFGWAGSCGCGVACAFAGLVVFLFVSRKGKRQTINS